MNTVVIANIISFCAGVVMVTSGVVKRKKNVILLQTCQNLLFASANLMLGGVSGFIVNLLTIARNLFCLKFPFTLPYKIFFLAAPAALSLYFNTNGLIGWMPIAAAALFTWFLDTKSDMTIKMTCLTGQILWGIFDFSLMNYSGFVFDIVTAASTIIGIFRLKAEKGASE